MVEPTHFEQLAAWIGLIGIVLAFVLIVIGISVRALRVARRMTTPPTLNAEIDAKVLMADNLHLHQDAPSDAEFGATNAARQYMKGRR